MILVLRAVIVLLLVPMAGVLSAQPPSGGTRTIADRVANLRKLDGFVPLYWDEASGRLLLEIAPPSRCAPARVSRCASHVASSLLAPMRPASLCDRRSIVPDAADAELADTTPSDTRWRADRLRSS
jgi:hypothetical protein